MNRSDEIKKLEDRIIEMKKLHSNGNYTGKNSDLLYDIYVQEEKLNKLKGEEKHYEQ